MGISPQTEKNDHEVFLENYYGFSSCCHTSTLDFYGDFKTEHKARGFIERIDDVQPTDKVHYIPHHPVKKDSATTPIRIVYDCSFHSLLDAPSLNDCLLVAPPFLNSMCSILLRFRTFTYGSWSSNSSSLRAQAAKDGTADTNEIVNILSLKWDPSTDTLTLTSSKNKPAQQLVTQRSALQVSFKVYDPLGLLSPVIIRAKLLIQESTEPLGPTRNRSRKEQSVGP
ncbi:hypothetical protein ACROYT_G024534 [Oculina patagonica]